MTTSRRRPVPRLAVPVLFLAALAADAGAELGAGAPQEAAAAFHQLELELLAAAGAGGIEMTVEVRSEGAFESALAGTVSLGAGNVARFDVDGSFGGPADLRLASDGARLSGGSANGEFDVATPSALNEAIVIGWTRMGILHNLAMLVGGNPPDHMEGGVREWVRVVDVEMRADELGDGRPARVFGFALEVEGQPSGTAELWFDAERRVPVRRTQTVQFENGEMRVVEEYRVSVSEPAPAQVVRGLLAAFNRHDPDLMLRFVAEDVGWYSVQGETVAVEARGRAALRDGMRAYFDAFPSARSEGESWMESGDYVIVRERASWARDGRRVSQSALAVYRVEGGLVTSVWYYPAER